MDIEIKHTLPLASEYVALRIRAGLSPKTQQAAEKGLPNSLYAVTIRRRGELIAMGRVIGDGGCFYQITDIAVAAEYQGMGLGRIVMKSIEHFLEVNGDKGSYISLIANEPLFYEQFGYSNVTPRMEGMGKVL